MFQQKMNHKKRKTDVSASFLMFSWWCNRGFATAKTDGAGKENPSVSESW
jgi:hypothetical protein